MSKEVEFQNTNPSTGKVQLQPNPQRPIAEEKAISFLDIFRYLSFPDFVWMLFGTIGAITQGACMPLSALLFGEVTSHLGPTASLDKIVHSAGVIALKFIYLGLVSFVTGYLGYSCWVRVGEKASNEIRKRYFKALLQQEMDFADSMNLETLSSKSSEECFKIQQGIGTKVPLLLQSFSLTISGFIIAFSKDWTLSLVLLSFYFIMMAISESTYFTKGRFPINPRAETIFEEVLNSIRATVSFSGQHKEIERYERTLQENNKMISKYAVLAGISIALQNLAFFGLNPLAVCFGSFFITGKANYTLFSSTRYTYTINDVYIVLLSLLNVILGRLFPFFTLEAFTAAKVNATKAFAIIQRSSQISIANEKKLKPTSCKGLIKFRNVKFADPLNQQRNILNGVSFDLRPNEITVFVGESDSGKNACLQLIERIYDIEDGKGSIFLDGNELKEINRGWLRENISYIGQEPVLFAISIKETLLMAKEDATDAEIWDALTKANAADFVQDLPDKLDTLVSRSDTSFSGAQKQRIAIARALLKNPTVLLLDEFTKALDRNDESEILKTILEISQGRTTILATDRLSTTINADHIIVFEEGKVAEEGNHEQLSAKQEKYYTQFQAQGQAEPPKIFQEEEKPSFVSHFGGEEDRLVNDESSLKEPLIASNASENKISQIALFKRLLNYSKDDLPLLIIGSIAAIFYGCSIPTFVFLFSNMINILGDPRKSNFSSRSGFFLKLFIVNILVAFIANSVLLAIFDLTSERLRKRVRKDIFRKFIRMPVRWFDEPANNPQALQHKLYTDISRLNGMIISVFSIFIFNISCFILTLAISFITDWRIAFIALAYSPLLILNWIMGERFSKEKIEGNKDAYQESHVFASEVIKSRRTIASFSKEKLFKKFSEKLLEPEKIAIKTAHFSSLALGGRDFLNLAFYAITFYIGAIVVEYYQLSFLNMFTCIMAVAYASSPIFNTFKITSYIRLCQKAVIDVFHILDAKPTIDIDAPNHTRMTPILGNVEFKNVWFKCKDKQILKNFNLKIEAFKKTALVGPLGCGKAAILDLIQRYYDVDSGEILIDGVNIKQYNVEHLRESFGVISKEPVLFDETIASNIKYGKEEANAEEVREAAAKANALEFIESSEFNTNVEEFDAGLKRKVGSMGAQLPYNQKQRIAIARIILKNPSVLILDEVTSDLDDENEKAVQKALDQIVQGKTSIIATSEISTVKDADEIILLNDGQIIKRGSYGGLMSLRET